MPDQTFNFVITNLSNVGMINFNILHTPYHVSEVDPGPSYGINEVNELHANQSYEVEADQRTNRAMVLRGKTETKIDPVTKKKTTVPLTVDESESTKDKKSKEGLYFYLSVVPDIATTALVNKFKEGTVWKAVPGFVRKSPRPPPVARYSHPPRHPPVGYMASTDRIASSRISPLAATALGLDVESLDTSNFIHTSASLTRGSSAIGFSMPTLSLSSFGSLRASQTRTMSSAPPAHSHSARPSIERMLKLQEESCSAEKGHVGSAAFTTDVDVGTTQAGELTYGEHVNVFSQSTGHEYAYEHASVPTVLCMSIWDEMKFLPLLDTIEKLLEEEVTEWIENEGKALIESLNAIYKEDKCVIDLESEADTIICTCGHQCINHENVSSSLRRCPICRSPVTAFVRADYGIVV